MQTAYPIGNIYNHAVLDDGYIYTYKTGTGWISTGIQANGTGITDGSVTKKKLDKLYAFAVVGKNLFDKTQITSGYYVSPTTGNLSVNASFGVSDYIEVDPNKSYRGQGSNSTVAYYDATKTFIIGYSYYTTGLNANPSPANAKYLRISFELANINVVMIEQNSFISAYEDYKQIVPFANLDLPKVTDYYLTTSNNIFDYIAVYCLNPNIKNIYNLHLAEGTYNIHTMIASHLSDVGFIGISLPDYVNIVGDGERDKIILLCNLTSPTLTQSTNISTLNISKNNNLKNLTVKAQNCRYAVHDDTNNANTDFKQNIENCVFEHLGNDAGLWAYTSAWGEGSSSGSEYKFKDCKFINNLATKAPYSTHTNLNSEKDTFHEFDNCEFINKADSGIAVTFSSVGSGAKDRVKLKGCKFVGRLQMQEETMNSVGNDFIIEGYGNQPTTYFMNFALTGQYTYNLLGETVKMRNVSGNTIPKGTPVKLSAVSTVVPMASTDTYTDFFGIAWEDIASGSYGLIKNSGYIRFTDTLLSAPSVGARVGISSGSLTVVTNTEFIGTHAIAGHLKFR